MKKESGKKKSGVRSQKSEGTGLSPCPFCGGAAEFTKTTNPKIAVTGCVSSTCMASIISVDQVDGRQKWNLRVEAPKAVAS